MLVLLGLGIPIYIVLSALGFIGYWLIEGQARAFAVVALIPYSRLAIYTFSVIPLFIFMGNMVFAAGFGRDLYAACRLWFGRLPGGLAQGTLGACVLFGAVCGSSIASAATFTRIAVPEMLRYGYSPKLATACVAAGGTISQMIPPSIIMVIYGLITQQSIGKLLIAGIIPGFIAAINFMIVVYIWAKLYPQDAPPFKEPWSWRGNLVAVKGLWGVVMIAAIVIGGIYTGVFTPTEAGALGAFVALFVAISARRFSWGPFGQALRGSAETTIMIHVILLGAFIYSNFLAITQIPQDIAGFLLGLQVPPIAVLIGIMVMYIVLGCFMDILSALFLTLPIIFPAILALGFDPIWFGVLVVHIVEIAMVTPPFGVNLFVVKGAAGDDVELSEIIRGICPFVAADTITLAIFIAFPELILFLPNLMLGK